jgi:hypothetical protein
MGTRAMRGWGASAALATQQIRPPDPYTTSADADAKGNIDMARCLGIARTADVDWPAPGQGD